MKTLFYYSVFFILQVTELSAQETSGLQLRDIIEKYIENSDVNADYTELLEQLTFRLEHPLNLNRAGKEELLSLLILSESQVNALINHRQLTGDFIGIYELQVIPGFDLNVISRLLPFVTLEKNFDEDRSSLPQMLRKGWSEILVSVQQDLQRKKGYIIADTATDPNGNYYAGASGRISFRYRFSYSNRLSYGVNGEKDPGEQFFKGAQSKGFDFYSAHLFMRYPGRLKTLAIGDFQAAFGQGLTFGTGLSFSKSSAIMNIRRNREELYPYLSLNEAGFLRGVGSTFRFGNFTLTGAYSIKKADGNPASNDSVQESFAGVSSIMISGLHRTPNEIEKKNTINIHTAVLNFNYTKRNLSIGITAVNHHFSSRLEKNGDVYKRFQFSGNTLSGAGISYAYLWRNMNFFGEATESGLKGFATVNGVLISADPKVDISILYRHYSKDFQTFSSTSFSETAGRNNESGFYTGIALRPFGRWALNAYFDSYRFPWLRYRTDAPSAGFDYLVELQYAPSKSVQMYWRLKEEQKQLNAPGQEKPIDFLTTYSRKTFRFHVTYKISDAIILKTRAELSQYKNSYAPSENGLLMYQDVSYNPMKSKLEIAGRIAFFDTDGFNSRLYAYENDVLYSFSVPAFSGKGSRFYFLFSYKPIKNLEFAMRYAHTVYEHVKSIGSGLEEIKGNVKSDIRVQIKDSF